MCKLTQRVTNFGDWNCKTDITKRAMLSTISKLFDPLGLIGPCAKVMLQELWIHKLDWDNVLPETLMRKWNTLKQELKFLQHVTIPRHIMCSGATRLELHAFSDASETAYGTCVYIRAILMDESVVVSLLCAKSRVAPIKHITVPRLELCGTLLTARVVKKIMSCINLDFHGIHLWSDSQIVLKWLKTQLRTLKTFVAHRVAEIQEITGGYEWHYVNTSENPADLISRGVLPRNIDKTMWWKGPPWLSRSAIDWPNTKEWEKDMVIPEVKAAMQTCMVTTKPLDNFPFKYTRSLTKLNRIVAWCVRFRTNCKVEKGERKLGLLSTCELNDALELLVKLSQRQSFPNELSYLMGNKQVIVRQTFAHLSPFLDSKNLIRVGGRLRHSIFNFNKKHPLIISAKHPLAPMIVEYEHGRLLHAGPQHTLASIRERFWITGGRNLTRSLIHKCIKCFRASPTECSQIMGDLPHARVTAMYPFHSAGVDFAGPFNLKYHGDRKGKTFKCYLSLFVCFSTKAVHIEPVTALTTESFLATFRRFIARRGKPAHVYSDNGTNFVGARNQLRELGRFLLKNQIAIGNEVNSENVNWHFIPANSPHFGGLWEAAVKSCKYHLRRVLGTSLITFENFLTIVAQIEGILNSRPLYPMSNYPNDFQPLTSFTFSDWTYGNGYTRSKRTINTTKSFITISTSPKNCTRFLESMGKGIHPYSTTEDKMEKTSG